MEGKSEIEGTKKERVKERKDGGCRWREARNGVAERTAQTEAEGNGNENLREVEDGGGREVDAVYIVTSRRAGLYVCT